MAQRNPPSHKDSSPQFSHDGSGRTTGARTLLVVPVLTRETVREDQSSANIRPRLPRSPEARREEALGLANAIALEVVADQVVMLADPKPATLLGSGKVAELAGIVADEKIELAIVDHALTPVQQRNLERELKAKVLDRTGLILEIFGERARTKEGTLQVELAHLEYQKGRLVRSWTHLERQRGGAGFLGGPGETQIEADRRLLQDKIIKLKRELETVRRTRTLHRAKRKKVPFPVVAIVGYTNAGKSTLFNRMTGADVLAEDQLFATLDPTLRRLRLPHGTPVILSDTVGFVSDLPTHLVAAFRATLEEVLEADLILHVRDISDPDTAAQAVDVERILADLGIEPGKARMIEVWNKIDLLPEEDRQRLQAEAAGGSVPKIAMSALTGEGLDALAERIEKEVAGETVRLSRTLSASALGLLGWIYENAHVATRQDQEDGSVSFDLILTRQAAEELDERLSAASED